MKSIVALTLASAGLIVSVAAANAADSIFLVVNAPAEPELRSSVSAAPVTSAVTIERETVPARKVRVVLPSPYAN